MNPDRPGFVRVVTLGVLAAAAAAGAGAAFDLDPRIVVTAALATVLEADVMWRAAQRQAVRRLARVRRILVELAGLLGMAGVSTAVWSADAQAAAANWPAGFLSGPVIGVWAISVGVWLTVTATLDDLARLGELSELVEDELLPVPRLRWRYLAVGSAALIGAAIGLTGWAALFELSRPPASGVLWGPLVYFPVGAIALGRVSMADAGKRWQAGRTQVGATVPRRAGASAMFAAAVLTGALLLAPSQDGAPAVRAVVVTFEQIGRAGEVAVVWLQSLLDRSGPTPTATAPAPAPLDVELPEPDVEEIEPGESVIGTETARTIQRLVFWLAVVVGVVVVARAVWRGRDELAMGIRALAGSRRRLAGLVALPARLYRSAVRGLRRWWLRLRSGPRREFEFQPVPARVRRGRRPQVWEPDDPSARRVVAAYRRFVLAAGARLGRKRPAETPAEYAKRVGELESELGTDAAVIAGRYEQVRYAPDPPDAAAATAVESALRRALARLDRSEQVL